MRALAQADNYEMLAIWMSTIAFLFMIALAAVIVFLFRSFHDLATELDNLRDEIDELKRPGAEVRN